MDCRNWVVKEAEEDASSGLVYYKEDLAVKFWWFDGRHYKDNTVETPTSDDVFYTSDTIDDKFRVKSATLVLHTDNSVLSAVPAAAAAIALSIMYAF